MAGEFRIVYRFLSYLHYLRNNMALNLIILKFVFERATSAFSFQIMKKQKKMFRWKQKVTAPKGIAKMM